MTHKVDHSFTFKIVIGMFAGILIGFEPRYALITVALLALGTVTSDAVDMEIASL